jgi:endonuclease YncB( thermonuclease family)
MGSAFEQEVDQEVRTALRQLVEVEKAIVIQSIAVERGQGGRARATVTFTDRVSGELQQENAILG